MSSPRVLVNYDDGNGVAPAVNSEAQASYFTSSEKQEKRGAPKRLIHHLSIQDVSCEDTEEEQQRIKRTRNRPMNHKSKETLIERTDFHVFGNFQGWFLVMIFFNLSFHIFSYFLQNNYVILQKGLVGSSFEFLFADFVRHCNEMENEIPENLNNSVKQALRVFLNNHKRIQREQCLYFVAKKTVHQPEFPLPSPSVLPLLLSELPPPPSELPQSKSVLELAKEAEEKLAPQYRKEGGEGADISKEAKEEELKRINQQQKRAKDVTTMASLRKRTVKLCELVEREYGSFLNFLKSVYALPNKQLAKKQLIKFVHLAVPSLRGEWEQTYEECIEEEYQALKKRFKNISYIVTHCLGLTEDAYKNIRSLIGEDAITKTPYLFFGRPFPMFLSATSCLKMKKNRAIEFNPELHTEKQFISKLFESVSNKENPTLVINPIMNGEEQVGGYYNLREAMALHLIELQDCLKHGASHITMQFVTTGDGSLKKKSGAFMLKNKFYIIHDSNVFKEGEEVRKIVEKVFPFYAIVASENKETTSDMQYLVGRGVGALISKELEINSAKFKCVHKHHCGDCSHHQKGTCNKGSTSNHRCPFCGACFHDDFKPLLLKWEHTNKLIPKSLKNIEKKRHNNELKFGAINVHIAILPLSKLQAEQLTLIFSDPENPSDKLASLSFCSHFSVGITQKDLKEIVNNHGGTWAKSKEQANIVFASYNTFQKTDAPLKNNIVSLRYLFKLIIDPQHASQDKRHFKFDNKQLPETVCEHQLDPSYDGRENTRTPMMRGVWEYLVETFEPEKAKSIFKEFVNNSSNSPDAMHTCKGTPSTICKRLVHLGHLKKEHFQNKHGTTFSKLSARYWRNIVCGFEKEIFPLLRNLGDKELLVKKLFKTLGELQSLCYISEEKWKIMEWSIHMWARSALFRQQLETMFPNCLHIIVNNYIHFITYEIPVINEKERPLVYATETSEFEWIYTNNLNTNHSLKNIIETSLQRKHESIVTRPTSSKKKDYLSTFNKENVWERANITFSDDREANALREVLEKYHYVAGEHFKLTAPNEILFCEVPQEGR